MLNAAFPAAELHGCDAGPVPLADWPLAAQLALLAGCVHALPAEQLLAPAGGGGAPLSLLLGWLLHTGMRSVPERALVASCARKQGGTRMCVAGSSIRIWDCHGISGTPPYGYCNYMLYCSDSCKM